MIFLADTSVLDPGSLRKLVLALAPHRGILWVPALIHAERLFQLRREKGSAFNMVEIKTWFDTYGDVVKIQNLDQQLAESISVTLHSRFPDHDAWRKIKRTAYRRAMGVEAPENSGTRSCGAPLDLYIAALATPTAPVVTQDKGPEWDDAPPGAVISLKEALARLESLPSLETP